MRSTGARRRHAGVLGCAALLLAACAQQPAGSADDLNAYPTNYKSDILGAMHAYLNDPTGVRDAAISEPALKSMGSGLTATPAHYMVCLRFNAKKDSADKTATDYAGMKVLAAMFIAGRFEQFIETPKELCADAAYAPFPELGKLSR